MLLPRVTNPPPNWADKLLYIKKPRNHLRGFYYVLKDGMRLETFESFT